MLSSVRFYLTVGIILMLITVGITGEISPSHMSVYDVVNARGGMSAFLLAIASAAALPFGLSYWEDKKHNYTNCLQPRCGLDAYCWSHALMAAIGAFLAVFAAYTLYFLLLSVRLPLVTELNLRHLQEALNRGEEINAFEILIYSGHYWTSFLFTVAEEAAGYAFMAEFAFMLSARVDNIYILLSTPIMLYYGSMLLCQTLNLPGIFCWYYVMASGGVLRIWFHDPLQLAWFVFEYFLLLILAEAIAFIILLKRSRKNG